MGAACPTCLGTVTTATGAFYNPFNPYYDGGYQYNIGTNLIWSPVKDLDIGVEVFYARDEYQHRAWETESGVSKTTKSADIWLSRLRISRDF